MYCRSPRILEKMWLKFRKAKDVGGKFPLTRNTKRRPSTQLRCIDPSPLPHWKRGSGTVDTTTLWRRPTLVAPCVSVRARMSRRQRKYTVFCLRHAPGEGNWQGQRHKEKVFVLQTWAPASRACLIWSERHLVVRNYMSPVYLIFDSYCTMLEGSSSLQSGQVFQLFQRSLSLSIQWSRKTSSLHACCITGKKKRLWRQQSTQMWKTL